MKATISGLIHATPSVLDPGKFHFKMFSCDMSGTRGFGFCVGPHSFEYEVPADFNPVAMQVAALRKEKEEAERVFRERITEINDQLSKLQAIEFDASRDNPANYQEKVA